MGKEYIVKNNQVYKTLCKIIFFLLPLIFFLPQQFYKNLYHSFPFWIVIFLGLALLPAAYISIKKTGSQKLTILFVVYLISLGLATLFSTNISSSLPILILNSAYFIIFLTSGEILSSLKAKEIFVSVFLGLCALLSVISFYNTFILGYINVTSEGLSFMWGYFGHNHLAVLLIAAIPVSGYFFWFSSKWLKLPLGLLLTGLLYSFLISFSRAAILALIFSLLTAGVIFYINRLNKINYKEILGMILMLLFLVFSLVLVMERKSLGSVYTRGFNFQKGIAMFAEKPIIGNGPATYVQKISNYNSAKRAFYPHNLIIQNFAEGGVILGTAVIALFTSLVINLVKIINRTSSVRNKYFYIALWIGITGILVNEMADFDLQLPAVGALFWVLIGLIYVRENDAEVS